MARCILAIIHLVQERHPVVDFHRAVVELGAVDIARGSSINTLGRTVLPHRAESAVSTIGIRITVAALNVSDIKAKLSCDLLRPPGHEVVLGSGGHAKDSALVVEGEILVLVAVASSSRVAKVHKVWNQLVHLERKHVVGERERSDADFNLV